MCCCVMIGCVWVSVYFSSSGAHCQQTSYILERWKLCHIYMSGWHQTTATKQIQTVNSNCNQQQNSPLTFAYVKCRTVLKVNHATHFRPFASTVVMTAYCIVLALLQTKIHFTKCHIEFHIHFCPKKGSNMHLIFADLVSQISGKLIASENIPH